MDEQPLDRDALVARVIAMHWDDVHRKDVFALLDLLERTEQERDEARRELAEQIEHTEWLTKNHDEQVARFTAERDEVRRELATLQVAYDILERTPDSFELTARAAKAERRVYRLTKERDWWESLYQRATAEKRAQVDRLIIEERDE